MTLSDQYVIYRQPIMRPQQPINGLRIGCDISRLVEQNAMLAFTISHLQLHEFLYRQKGET